MWWTTRQYWCAHPRQYLHKKNKKLKREWAFQGMISYKFFSPWCQHCTQQFSGQSAMNSVMLKFAEAIDRVMVKGKMLQALEHVDQSTRYTPECFHSWRYRHKCYGGCVSGFQKKNQIMGREAERHTDTFYCRCTAGTESNQNGRPRLIRASRCRCCQR